MPVTRALALLLALLLTVAAFAQGIAFRFNPPDLTYSETVTTTRVKDMGPLGKETEESTATARITIARTPTGYSVAYTPLTVRVTREGVEVKTLAGVLQAVPLTYTLAPDGRALVVKGYHDIGKRLAKELPEGEGQLAAKLVNEQALATLKRDEWNRRLALAGRTLANGESFTRKETAATPVGGTLATEEIITLQETPLPGQPTACQVGSTISASPEAVKTVMGGIIANAFALGEAKPTVAAGEMAGEGLLVLDPATLLPQRETRATTWKIILDLDGLPLPIAVSTRSEYRYAYAQ